MPQVIEPKWELMEQSLDYPRELFSALYDELVNEQNRLRQKSGEEGEAADEFKVLEQLLQDGQTVFQAAFAQAAQQRWLPELCMRLKNVDGLKPINSKAENLLTIQLQSILNSALGFSANYAMTQGGLKALRRVCRVEVTQGGATSYGTGFLVGPQAILTAWHVISPLLEDNGKPRADSARCLRVQFDHVGAAYEVLDVRVADQWLVAFSPCHDSEKPGRPPVDYEKNPPEGFDQCLDYAVIRLNKVVGRLRGFYELDPQHKPNLSDAGAQLTLYQHPAGNKMHSAVGIGLGLWPSDHQTRLKHSANSLGGSSGGLLVDVNFKPVALHQCGMRSGEEEVNGAIPIAHIAARSGAVLHDVLGLDPVWRTLSDHEPILGRRDFQNAVQSCIPHGQKQIIAVTGLKVLAESGRSISLEILHAMLRDSAQYTIITFQSLELGNDARAFAEKLLRRAGAYDDASEPLPEMSESDTSMDAWVKNILFPEFARRLTAGKVAHQLWLVIEDLDINPLAPGSLQHFLEQVYRDIANMPMLRIVLLGSKVVVPGARAAQLCSEIITPIGRRDYVEYLEHYGTEHELDLRQEEIERLATVIEKSCPLVDASAPDAASWFIQQCIHPALKSL